MALHVYDGLRRTKVAFEPIQPGRAGMYVCGMTVQAGPHIGHMRGYVTADVIRRVLRARGYQVTLVQNFTDIDDKIIAKANEAGVDPKAFAERNIAAYFEAADWLSIERADFYPRATEHIPEILTLIGTLIEKGFAYASGGDVFFAVTRKSDYGKLSGKRIDELRMGVRVEVDEDKRHPVDFTLWKKAKPGEPFWESPWGPGRPGWHIECSAMAMKYLGATFDLHGGGRDLVFPHHENEIAQAEAATGQPFCRHWVEGGLVNLGGQKMSKSTGVVFNVQDVRREVDPVSLRLYLLSTHYRSPIEYARERLDEAVAKLDRLRNFLQAAAHAAGENPPPARPLDDLEGQDAEFRTVLDRTAREFDEALDDDFNAAGAIGKMFELVREANIYLAEGGLSPWYKGLLGEVRRQLLSQGGLLGLRLGDESGAGETAPAEVLGLVRQREEARRRKAFGEADRLRDLLRDSGWLVDDRPDGSLVKKLE